MAVGNRKSGAQMGGEELPQPARQRRLETNLAGCGKARCEHEKFLA
jgi:hypothetical protein